MKLPRKIYALVCVPTGKMYIGSSFNVAKRFRVHISQLRHGKHPVGDMQADFDRYGSSFKLYILDEIKDFSDRDKEYQWMTRLKTFDRRFGYNYSDPKWPQLRNTTQ
jgi:group I intron endonuclease